MYSQEPEDSRAYTEQFDQAYTRFASMYDLAVKWLPVWRAWISRVIPEIRGHRVLEVSFGTGYLMTKYAAKYSVCGFDYNFALASKAKRNLLQANLDADLQQADVHHIPYQSGCFDTVVNTMAFSGYPDGLKAMREMKRVLKPEGRLVLLDVNYPKDRNTLGMALGRGWAKLGDIIRDMEFLFRQLNLEYTVEEVGGFGSIHLYIATKVA